MPSIFPMLPVRRDLKFRLPAGRLRDWTGNGLHVSHFFNAMSILFPVGERFFIHSVRNFRDRITDPDLQKAITAFIGQEAMHTREHEEYNEAMSAAGLPVKEMEARVRRLLEYVKRTASPELQLGATVALEHFTAIMADILLRHPELFAGADPSFNALWRWHALEETEHKAVAFDVYQQAVGTDARAYAIRVLAMVLATLEFWSVLIPYHLQMVRRDGGAFDLRGWLKLARFHWLKQGFLRRLIPAYLDYFRPGFHPWDHDNRQLLAEVENLSVAYQVAA